jgi:hypothetical protein
VTGTLPQVSLIYNLRGIETVLNRGNRMRTRVCASNRLAVTTARLRRPGVWGGGGEQDAPELRSELINAPDLRMEVFHRPLVAWRRLHGMHLKILSRKRK